jgi:Bacterial Ig-like domain
MRQLLLLPLVLAPLAACQDTLVVESYLGVVNVSPSHGAANVSVDVDPVITFTEELVAEGIGDETIQLRDASGIALAASIEQLDTNSVLVLPEDPLYEATPYTVWIGSTLEGQQSGPLGMEVETSFTTEGVNPGGNSMPVAVLEPLYEVVVGEVVTFDGSQSFDPEGAELQYLWQLVSAPAETGELLDGMFGDSAELQTDVVGTWVISLTVNDGELDGSNAWAQVRASQ